MTLLGRLVELRMQLDALDDEIRARLDLMAQRLREAAPGIAFKLHCVEDYTICWSRQSGTWGFFSGLNEDAPITSMPRHIRFAFNAWLTEDRMYQAAITALEAAVQQRLEVRR